MSSTKPTLVVDIDGVLFDTPRDAVAASNLANNTSHSVSDIFNHHAEHDKSKFVIDGIDQFHKFQSDTSFYKQVPGAKQALERLSGRVKVIALTSRNYDMFYDVTVSAIKKHFGDLVSEVYFTTAPGSDQHREKGEIAKQLGGQILIDDAVKYCQSAVDHGLIGILLQQPYNESGHDWPVQYRAKNWQEVAEITESELDRLIHTQKN